MLSREAFAGLVPAADAFDTWRAVGAADAVFHDRDAIVRTVKFSYAGTIPPPPWPQSPEMVAAAGRLARVRDGLEVLARRKIQRVNPTKAPAIRAELLSAGGTLLEATAAMAARFEKGKENQATFADAWEILKAPFEVPGAVLALAFLLWVDRRG